VVEGQLGLELSPDKLKLSGGLDELNARYRVRQIKPLFKDFKKNRQQLKALLKKDKATLTKKEKHILRRLKRAPKDAKVPDLSRIYKIELDLEPGESLEEAVQAYNNHLDVEYAELNYVVSIDLTPNDPLYPIQWPLNNTGQEFPFNVDPLRGVLWMSGEPDCDIDAPEAWDIHTGNSEIIVAVVDTGVDYNHRDLDDNMWVNSDEIPDNGIDDDGNGYIDDVYGYDFCTYTQESDSDPIDDCGHGTHCAGIIAAQGNNALDIAGVCWNARIMALKFLNSAGWGYTADGAACFYYAVNNGADVTSNSWGGGGYLETMEEAINYAHSQGVIMVASAGNSGSASPQYPARYDHMVAVAATGSNDKKAYWSNYGDWVDIAAPGVDVLSLRASMGWLGIPYDDYTCIMSGTSMACPHVAGVYALTLSYTQWDANLVIGHVINTADPLSSKLLGSGRLNAFNALTASPGIKLVYRDYMMDDSLGDSDGKVDPGETFYLYPKIKNNWGPASNVCAALTSDSPWVQIIAENVSLGTLAPQQEMFTSDPFVIRGAPYCPLESAIPFTVTLSADGGYSEDYTFCVYPKIEWVHEGLDFSNAGEYPALRSVAVDRQGTLYACEGRWMGHRSPDERDGGPSNGFPPIYSAFRCAVSGPVVYVYIGLGDWDYGGEFFIYRSPDFGNTWAPVVNPEAAMNAWVRKIVPHSSDRDTVYLLVDNKTTRNEQLYVSTDGGVHWQLVYDFGGTFMNDFTVDPTDPTILYACGSRNTSQTLVRNAYFYKSTDSGASWTITSFPEYNAEAEEVDVAGSTVYLALGGAGVCKSVDRGETWTVLDGRASRLHVDIRNSEILYDCSGPNKSFDGGHTFHPITFGPYPTHGMDTAQAVFYPYRVYVAAAYKGVFSYNSIPSTIPTIEVAPYEIEFSAPYDVYSPNDQVLSVWNGGEGTLVWEISEDCPWLEVAPLSGQSTGIYEKVNFNLSADTTGLPPGDHNCVLTISAPGAVYHPRAVNVNLHIKRPMVHLVPCAKYPTIQAAIDGAADGDFVTVTDGTYTGDGNRDIDLKGKAITVRSRSGPENCVIDCQGTLEEPYRAFHFHTGESPFSVVEGFTITGGYAGFGGAMEIDHSSPTVRNCILTDNTAQFFGGGIENYYACPTLINCTFSGNSAWYGGAAYNFDSSATLSNCIFSNNTADYGAGVDNAYSSPVLVNCTFSGNSAAVEGGGILNFQSLATIKDCILWDNTPEEIYSEASAPLVTYCDVQAGHAGEGNIDVDPLFVDAANGDYHLSPGSFPIDAGDPNSDYSNEPWPNGGRVNMGAYGNTKEATRSSADFDDLAQLCAYWLEYDPALDIAPVPVGDGIINFLDFAIFADCWLWAQ
jgi:subtilisin family serine protease